MSHTPGSPSWTFFGTHLDPNASDTPCAYSGTLEFGPNGEDGLPNVEWHSAGSQCTAAVETDSDGCYTRPDGSCISPGECVHTRPPS